MPLDRFHRVPQDEQTPNPRTLLFVLILLCGVLALVILARSQMGEAASGCYARFAPPAEQQSTSAQPAPTSPGAKTEPKPDFSIRVEGQQNAPPALPKAIQKPTESGTADSPKTH